MPGGNAERRSGESGVISVPNWTTTGPNQEATDLSSFNPVTQVLYYAMPIA